MSEMEMNDLIEKLHRVEGQLHRLQACRMRAHGPQGNPHRGQGRVLALLKLQPEISQKELGYLLDMRQQSLSELLAKLEQKGYITRTPSQEDRRTTVITLTEAGRAAAGQAEEQEPGMRRIFDSLSPEEQANLASYLDRIAAALEKETEAMEKEFGPGMGRGPRPGGPDRRGTPPPHRHHGRPGCGHGHGPFGEDLRGPFPGGPMPGGPFWPGFEEDSAPEAGEDTKD